MSIREDGITCENCKFAIMQEHGYSNYTVEGCDFECAKKLHPDGTFDRFYGENPKFLFARKCIGYDKGNPIELDVDGEHTLTDSEKEVIKVRDMTNLVLGKQ